jgi:hypothetical protein
MGTGIAAFYATSAAVIPVLVAVYLVQLRGWLQRSNDSEREHLSDVEAGRYEGIKLRSFIIHGAKLSIATVAWLWPVWAEVGCFASLAEENSAPGGTLVVASGVAIAGIVALGPLIYVNVVEPQIISARLIRALLRTIKETERADAEEDAEPSLQR